MKSMTGYGKGLAKDSNVSVSAELLSVNRKGLDVFLSFPVRDLALENIVLQKVKERFLRGRISVTFKIEYIDNVTEKSLESIKPAVDAFKNFCEKLGVDSNISAELLYKFYNEKSAKENTLDTDLILSALEESMQNFDEMRSTEGQALEKDFLQRLDFLNELVGKIEIHIKDTVQNYRETLYTRLSQANLEFDLDDVRVLREISLFADKCDVSEEITRLKIHLEHFRNIIKEESSIGRKLDFLCQELGREINTLSVKCSNMDAIALCLDFKNELERVREQVQNIE